MSYFVRTLFGEKSVSKVAALYGGRSAAERAAAQLAGVEGLSTDQVRLLGPDDARRSQREIFARTVEPEGRGIFLTMLRSHVIIGSAGALFGVLLFAALYASGLPLVASSPVLAFIAIVGFATTFGLLAAGALTLRPDHALLMNELRTALEAKRWAVIVHPFSEQQFDAARNLLRSSGARVLTTL